MNETRYSRFKRDQPVVDDLAADITGGGSGGTAIVPGPWFWPDSIEPVEIIPSGNYSDGIDIPKWNGSEDTRQPKGDEFATANNSLITIQKSGLYLIRYGVTVQPNRAGATVTEEDHYVTFSMRLSINDDGVAPAYNFGTPVSQFVPGVASSTPFQIGGTDSYVQPLEAGDEVTIKVWLGPRYSGTFDPDIKYIMTGGGTMINLTLLSDYVSP